MSQEGVLMVKPGQKQGDFWRTALAGEGRFFTEILLAFWVGGLERL